MQKQKGMVLVISLILLIVLTLIGISSMQNTIVEEKMAGNSRDRDLALKGAEAAVRAGETYVGTLTTTSGFTNANGLYAFLGNDPDYLSATTWSGTNSVT